jgi:indoleamine 2,3-dioxygenase
MTHHLPRGFLPENDPLSNLPAALKPWEDAANRLPKLLVSNQFRHTLENLPDFNTSLLSTPDELERAMIILSYFGHAYVWGEKTAPTTLPAKLAKPWVAIAAKLKRPPVLSYASYALHNWMRIDPRKPIGLDNIALIQNFLGGVDEEWFILIHVAIEAKAALGLNGAKDAIKALETGDVKALHTHVKTIETSLTNMCDTLDRMPEKCDPYIYYNRVRPYIHGWKNHPSYPEGLIYEGEYDNKPQQFRGETGAQSSIIPTMDGFLGITHGQDQLYHYLQEMRDYMPEAHREFLSYIEKHSTFRSFVMQNLNEHPELKTLYNSCINLINRFRQTHLAYAASYIQKQHQASAENPNAVGTGGTPFMTYLKKHATDTAAFLLE